MAFSFTHAALLDRSLEDLAVVLENRLVGTRFWLPSRQELEIRRTGTWLDYPVRGIIRGRWEIAEYNLNVDLPPARFAGPEIVTAAPAELKRYPWKGAVLRSRACPEAPRLRAAAVTTSLPEALGGERNWDYRYCWIRDTSFALEALLQLGCTDEAHSVAYGAIVGFFSE